MRNRGFSLLEMSMVLIVIGLLAGSIFVGQALIRSSHLHAALSDAAKYTTAVMDFHDKYMALPGDMSTAQNYWGTPAGGCPEGNGTGNEVCNGNGDGLVCGGAGAANIAELRSEWIELANAGFISSSYRYTAASSGIFDVSMNTPSTEMQNATFQFFFATCPLGDGLYTASAPYNIHWLAFGRLVPASGILMPVMTGAEAMNLDKKADNGLPGTGSIRGPRTATAGGNTPSCQTSAVPDTAQYNLALGDINTCYLIFAMPN